MAAPIVTYWDRTSASNISNSGWNIGEISSGEESDHFVFNIWNNKGGTSVVANMRNVTLSILNVDGKTSSSVSNNANAMIGGKWTRVKVNGGNAVQIGEGAKADLYGLGYSSASSGISGEKNDGNMNTAATKRNYASIESYVIVPANVAAGTQKFILRTSYSYT